MPRRNGCVIEKGGHLSGRERGGLRCCYILQQGVRVASLEVKCKPNGLSPFDPLHLSGWPPLPPAGFGQAGARAREKAPGFALLLPAIKWLVKEMQVSVKNAARAAAAGGDAPERKRREAV